MDKFLIINADDYGYNKAQTEAITELYSKKLISSLSLMAVAPYADAACSKAKDAGFQVGVHLTVNSDSHSEPWQSVSKVKSLSISGGLPHKQRDLTLHAKRADVRCELEAQYEYIRSRGCAIDHADNHCATLYGINGRRFYIDAFEFCKKHSLPFRFPGTPDFIRRQLNLKRLPKAIVLAHRHILNAAKKYDVKLPDDIVSNPLSMQKIGNYEALRKYYLDAIEQCRPGVTEIFLHPSYPLCDGDNGEWTKRIYEFRLLKSGDLLQKAQDKKIKLVSWGIFKELN